MQNPEQFLSDEIVQRWPNWEPTPPQRRDWQELIKPYRERDVLAAVRNLALKSDYKTPSLPTMRGLLKGYSFARPLYMRPVFVQCETGEFQKVYIQSKQDISDETLREEGMDWARKLQARQGGKWIVHIGKTDSQMAQQRHDLFVENYKKKSLTSSEKGL